MTLEEIPFHHRRLVTVRQLAGLSEYGWLTESAIRHLIFEAPSRYNSKGERIEGNGLEAAIIRIGRRLLIDLRAWDQWIDSHRAEVAADD